jgi:ParB-like chromosome segregation protein Spo0J
VYIPINQITIDEEIYPRNQRDWMLTYVYENAMKAGAEFPPILVGEKRDWMLTYVYENAMKAGAEFPPILVGEKGKRQYVIIDGAHRFTAWQKIGKDKVPAVLSQRPEKDWLYESIEINSRNGKSLTVQEKLTNAVRLQEQGYSPQEVSAAVFIPEGELTRLIAERAIVRSSDKSALVAKAVVTPTKEQIHTKDDQQHFYSRNQISALKEILELLERNLLDAKNEEIIELVKNLEKTANAWLYKMNLQVEA